jgi:c-di-GMP-binding flagellar brake protein YcgR
VSARRRTGIERRRFARVSAEAVVSCTPRGASDGSVSRTLNFSAGGLLFLSPTLVEAGRDVDLVLRLPGDAEDLVLSARIVRVRSLSDQSHETAVEFVGGDAGAQRALLDYISERAAFEPDPFGPRIA